MLSLTSDRGHPWPRRVVLNKTNALRLAAAYGDDYPDWVGKRLEIWAEAVQFQGKLVQGLHVEPSLGAPVTAQAPAPVRPSAGNGSISLPGPVTYPPPAAAPGPIPNDIDDEIPF